MTNFNASSKNALRSFTIAILVVPLLSVLALTPQDGSGAGQEVYEAKCGTCHGKTGNADTKAGQMTKTPDLTTTPWANGTSQDEVEKVVMEGAGKMPAYKEKLTVEEITAVSAYTRKLTGVDDQ